MALIGAGVVTFGALTFNYVSGSWPVRVVNAGVWLGYIVATTGLVL